MLIGVNKFLQKEYSHQIMPTYVLICPLYLNGCAYFAWTQKRGPEIYASPYFLDLEVSIYCSVIAIKKITC